ncbi:MAG TPA: nuclear transport factor 2 family protein [Candidatus Limnocylindrales bacterium]|nr:nuclear transport factor 2 family protein [Candidatus Limnocylindrales bacterium]
MPSNEDIARRYAEAASRFDLDSMAALRHPDWQARWPQSGERVITDENYRKIVAAYPGGSPTSEIERVVGAEDRWVVTPSNTVQVVAGSGDFWWSEWRMTYPDRRQYNCVDLIELRDGAVWRETVYWAEPFEAPDWRAQWVTGQETTG